MNISTDPWVWVSAFGVIAVLSGILFKDNDVFRAVENIFVGASSGYFVYTAFKTLVDLAFIPLTSQGKISLLIPIALGLMLYTRYVKKYAWMSRWGTAFLVAVGSGLAIYASVTSQFIAQIKANLVPLNNMNNIVMVVGVISVLFYFFFSFKQNGPMERVSKLGRYVMMITFGVSFGNVVMGRISLLLGVLDRLLGDWLGMV